ncbi:hypothetical protein S40285_09875 [Stachybotrys chlorohalonatus IBT 40285]|uniref:Uncharacterized protein n=1 Tax=Stachybotrys chlorohalonatus (strain IBT 40285) TaxID=1283841 RepID=A0A084QUY6_STAC4|nr:hypothetical protein S40285_09875 [Stachybotrys chlorohalonata IBT 40285]
MSNSKRPSQHTPGSLGEQAGTKGQVVHKPLRINIHRADIPDAVLPSTTRFTRAGAISGLINPRNGSRFLRTRHRQDFGWGRLASSPT